MPIWVDLLLVAFLIFLNAFFVIGEFACVRVRKSQIDIAYEQGKRGAKNARFLTANVNSTLAVCQLGITVASLAIGWLGEPAVSALIEPLFGMTSMPVALSAAIATALGFIIVTFFHVVVGEQIPKALCLFNTEGMALGTATPLRLFYRVTYPLVVLFTAVTNAAVRLLGYDPTKETEAYSDEEIKLLIDESTEEGLISSTQNEFVDNIFELGDKDAQDLMTPRIDVICLDMEDSLAENLATVRQYKYTRYPVCDGSKDRIIGFVHVKDLFGIKKTSTMDDLPIRPIEAVPESITIQSLLQLMQTKRTEIAIVVDEHGGTAGIVTLSDIVEQIMGRIDDEYRHDMGEEAKKLEDGTYLVDGLLPIDELVELLDFEPEEAKECETAAGLLLALFDRIPEEGDKTSTEFMGPEGGARATFTVLDMDRLRIDKIQLRLEQLDPPEEE